MSKSCLLSDLEGKYEDFLQHCQNAFHHQVTLKNWFQSRTQKSKKLNTIPFATMNPKEKCKHWNQTSNVEDAARLRKCQVLSRNHSSHWNRTADFEELTTRCGAAVRELVKHVCLAACCSRVRACGPQRTWHARTSLRRTDLGHKNISTNKNLANVNMEWIADSEKQYQSGLKEKLCLKEKLFCLQKKYQTLSR